MKNYIERIAARTMPSAYRNLRMLARVNASDETMLARVIAYESEVRELRAELNEVRRDNRRVVELYDLVFDRLREDMPLRAQPVPTSTRND
ncbi:hypothetical protein [Agromyces cerinus]|uniref:Uncharacterized protein n=1 Tax=Agromyces cerinus subsp. cerinus TaxID=232089 RepID=A0A1N6DIH6_9MICO|nr:hypothetical protein [Agromyces cerinus]SIN70527.1 hypothetical protein SAMN05443544_0267 [Agromyces cerinus subsp. cerinus]